MVQRFCTILVSLTFVVSLTFAGAEKVNRVTPFHDAPVSNVAVTPTPESHASNPQVGSYTGISGFYDYQSNGGVPQYIRVNPSNGNIHIVMMTGIDSASISAGRRTAYALSTDGGGSWNSFNNLFVPNRRSGFPSLDLGQAAIAGAPIIANHSTITGTQSTALIDFPEGSGAFAEVGGPPGVAGAPGSDEPIWPFVAGASDGSIVMAGSRSSGLTNWITRSADYTSWGSWAQYPDSNDSGGRYITLSNSTGRVAVLLNTVDHGVYLLESTDNGVSWPAHSTTVFGPWPQTADSLTSWVAVDGLYNGDNVLAAFSVSTSSDPVNIGYDYAGSRIMFWSQATGLVTAVAHDTTLFLNSTNNSQSNHLTVDWPAIGVSGNQIVIAFIAFSPDTATDGHHFLNIWAVNSSNGGATWSPPTKLTTTPDLDTRYPSISKYNPPGFAYMVWQEDTMPGNSVGVGTDAAPVTRSRQVFYKYPIPATGVDEKGILPSSFSLEQNYPNPFNPATTIDYPVPQTGPVTIKVFNALGQEVATLVNELRAAGTYRETFDATSLSSGVYIYRMQSGNFAESKKMLFLK